MDTLLYVKRCLVGIFFFLIIVLPGCSSFERVEYRVQPAKQYMRDIYSVRAVRRTLSCTVGAEYLSDEQVDTLGRRFPFSSSGIGVNDKLPYNLSVFCLTVSNVSEKPVKIGKPWIKIRDSRQEFLEGRALVRKLQRTQLTSFASNKPECWYRVGTQELRFDHLVADQLVVYDFDELLPNDTLLTICVSDFIPLQYSSFSLIVPVASERGEKVVELEFVRIHNRRL